MTPEDPEEIPLLLRPGGSAPRGRHLFLAAFAASLGSLSFGFALGYSSPAIPSLRRSAAPAPRLDDSTASWFGVYISEIAYPAIRGLLGAFVQLMVVTGILFAYLAGWVLEWHWLAVLGCGPPTLMLLLMWCMPETPRFLLSQHKLLEARSAMCFLWGSEADWEEPPIGAEYQGFQLTLLRHPGIYKPFIIGISLMAFQQLSGINAIMFYTETIFEEAKFKNSNLASVIVGAIQVLFTGIAALIMDRAGRRLLLILSGFALGWGPIPWLLMSEIFPLHIKGMATGVCVLTNWLMAFLVTKEFSTLMEALRPCGTFWLASGFCICSVLFTWFCVPETKGKTLEQITAHFEGR